MTDRKQALIDLRDKVKAGELYRKKDCIIMLDGDGFRFCPQAIDWTMKANKGSLDAAKALHEAVIPEWQWEVSTINDYFQCYATVFNEKAIFAKKAFSVCGDGPLSQGWLIAILEALIAQEEQTQ